MCHKTKPRDVKCIQPCSGFELGSPPAPFKWNIHLHIRVTAYFCYFNEPKQKHQTLIYCLTNKVH